MNTEVLHRCLGGKSHLPKVFSFLGRDVEKGDVRGTGKVSWTHAQCHKVRSSQEIFQKRSASLSGRSLLSVFPRDSVGDFPDDQIFRWSRRREGRSGLSCSWANPAPRKPLFRKTSIARGSTAAAPERPLAAELSTSLGPLQDQGAVVTAQASTGMLRHPLAPVPFHSDWFVIPFHCTKSWIKKPAYI